MTAPAEFYGLLTERLRLRPDFRQPVSDFVRAKTGCADLATFHHNGSPDADKVATYLELLGGICRLPPVKTAPKAVRRPTETAPAPPSKRARRGEMGENTQTINRDAFELSERSDQSEPSERSKRPQDNLGGVKTQPSPSGERLPPAALRDSGKSSPPEPSTETVLVDVLREVAAQGNHSVTLRVGDVSKCQ